MDRRTFLLTTAASVASAAAASATGVGAETAMSSLQLEPRGESFPADASLYADFGDVRHLVWAAGGVGVAFVAPRGPGGLALTLTASGRTHSLAALPAGRSVIALGSDAELILWRS